MMDIRKIRCTVPCQVEEAKSGCHCAEARAEIERLRAALLAFADHFGPLEGNPFLHEDALRCFALARAALDEGRT